MFPGHFPWLEVGRQITLVPAGHVISKYLHIMGILDQHKFTTQRALVFKMAALREVNEFDVSWQIGIASNKANS